MTTSLEDTAAELIQLFQGIGILNEANFVEFSGAAVTIPDPTVAANSVIVLTEPTVTITLPPPITGKRLTIFAAQDSTGGRLVDWETPSGAIIWAGPNTEPVLQTLSTGVDQINFTCPIGGDYWIGSSAAGGAMTSGFTSAVITAAGAYTWSPGGANALLMAGSATSLVVDDATTDQTPLFVLNALSIVLPVTISVIGGNINNGNGINPGESFSFAWSSAASSWVLTGSFYSGLGYAQVTSSTPFAPVSGIPNFLACSNPGSTVDITASPTPIGGEIITVANVDSTGTTVVTFDPTSTTVAYPDVASWTYDTVTSAYVPTIVPGGGGGGGEAAWTISSVVHGTPLTPVSGANTWVLCDTTAGSTLVNASAAPVAGETIRMTCVAGTHPIAFDAYNWIGGSFLVGAQTLEFMYDATLAAYVQTIGIASMGGAGTAELGGPLYSLDSSGVQRNTFDDGTGNGGVAGTFTVDSVVVTAGTPVAGQPLVASSPTAASFGAMNNESGAISSTVDLIKSATTTVFSTASLGVGVWMVFAAANVSVNQAASAGVDLELVAGTATATLSGKVAAGSVNANDLVAGSGLDFEGVVFATVTVTVAGTLILQAVNNDSGYDATAEYQSQGGGAIAGATGYTAVQIG